MLHQQCKNQYECPIKDGNSERVASDSENDSDDTFVFQDVYDMLNIPNLVGGDYNRSWGTYAIESDPWDDRKCPYVNILNKAELKLNKDERKGILTTRMLAACSSYLSKSPITQQYVLCKCNLSRSGLKQIDILKYHHHFEYIDLSYNRLISVSALENAGMLMYINVTHNMLEDLLDFRPPLNLTFVNYSHNCITKIKDLENYWSIVQLDISHNDITNIEGIDNLKYLQVLNLSHNSIESIKNIDNLQNLIRLNLSNNKIIQTECKLNNLQQLRYIDLSHNKIKTLKIFRVHSLKVKQIIITHNLISNLLQLTHLQNLSHLVELDLRKNTITSHALFWDVALNCLCCIRVLNNTNIAVTQKHYATSRFNPSVQIILSKKKNMLRLLNSLRSTRIIPECMLPANIPPPPLIILVGPLACKKNKIAIRFAETEENVKLFINHTTRPIYPKDIDGLDYHFISNNEFEEEIRQGEFLTVFEVFGHMFGLHKRELEKANTYRNHVFITHTDLISALLLRDHGYMPTIVLAIPKSCETHREWIKEQYQHEYINNYCANVLEKQMFRYSPDIALDTTTALEDIIHSICMIDELVERATSEPQRDNNDFELALIEETEREQEELGTHSDIGEDLTGIIDNKKEISFEKSCLRNTESTKDTDNMTIASTSALRPTVTFGDIEENVLSTEEQGRDSMNNALLGYDSGEIFLFNAMREVQERIESAEELQILRELFKEQPNMTEESQVDKTTEPRLKTPFALQYYKRYIRFAKEAEIFADSVIKTRNFYIDYHKENPGIFSNVLYTDESDDKIMATLRDMANSRRKIKIFNDIYSYIGQEDSTRMINIRKQEIARSLQCSKSTAVCQQTDVDNYVEVLSITQRYNGP